MRDIPDGEALSRRFDAGSQQVENFVDNAPAGRCCFMAGQPSARVALKSVIEKLFQINDLPHAVLIGGQSAPAPADRSTAVELSARSRGLPVDG
jgi:hypothetical protein